jgi:hypothetical protein
MTPLQNSRTISIEQKLLRIPACEILKVLRRKNSCLRNLVQIGACQRVLAVGIVDRKHDSVHGHPTLNVDQRGNVKHARRRYPDVVAHDVGEVAACDPECGNPVDALEHDG